MAILAPPLTSIAGAVKTISYPGPLAEDIVAAFRRVRVGTGGNLRYACALDASVDVITDVRSGETLAIAGTRVFASGTTAEDITIYM